MRLAILGVSFGCLLAAAPLSAMGIETSTYLGGTSWDEGVGVAVDAAGNSYVVGSTCSADFPISFPLPLPGGSCDAFVAKFDAAGGLVYSTYLCGTSYDEGIAIAVDAGGRALVAGLTYSADFPIVGGVQRVYAGGGDAFVAMLDPSGKSLVYSTFLGGSGFDSAWAIAVDAWGQAHVAGLTRSANFPTAWALQPVFGGGQDAFVAKLNAWRTHLQYSTYLGGTKREGAAGLALDAVGRAWVTGWSESSDFPLGPKPLQAKLGGGIDAYLTLIEVGGALAYSSYLGGSGDEAGSAIAVDGLGRPVVAGVTTSKDFPTAAAAQPFLGGSSDGFVARLAAPGTKLDFSTYLGGSSYDVAWGVGVGASGAIHVAGATNSANFPVVGSLQPFGGIGDAFVARLDATGRVVDYATFLGGSEDDVGRGLALDAAEHAHVTGYTQSVDFPIYKEFQPVLACPGQADAFLTRISP